MKKVINILKNKYFVTCAFFLVIFLFLDENNLFVTLRLKKEVSQLEQQAASLHNDIARDSILAQSLRSDRTAIECYGRETYYMKRADEDIYIIK